MIYVMSDLHGMYNSYLKMLKKIQFSTEDSLYILGDVIDRGPDPILILQDMMCRPNVYPLFGNHEWMAMRCLPWLRQEITDDFLNSLDLERLMALADWLGNGAQSTLNGFASLSKVEQDDLLDYLGEFQAYEVLKLNGIEYVLVHAGLGNFRLDKDMGEYTLEELVWERPKSGQSYFNSLNRQVIVGHTPTLSITGKPEVIRSNSITYIDCGACFDIGRLSCLCLDTNEVFYV